MHGFGVSPRAYASTNGCDDRGAERLAGVERHVREAEPVTRLPCGDHGLGRAAGPLRGGRIGVDPQPECDPDRRGAGPQQSHGAVHAPAHRDSDPLGIGVGAKTGPSAFASASTDESLAGDGGSLEQRQADE